jgi:KEOPS complex subunit Cgi121
MILYKRDEVIGEVTEEKNEVEIHQVRFHVSDKEEFLQKLRTLGKKNQCTIICFNQHTMAGIEHVKTALQFALRSFSSKSPISRSIEVEALLYAAGTRQTGFISSFGIQTGENECYLCILPPKEKLQMVLAECMKFVDTEMWENLSLKKRNDLKKIFGITETEIKVTGKDRIVDLVLERVALLNINR